MIRFRMDTQLNIDDSVAVPVLRRCARPIFAGAPEANGQRPPSEAFEHYPGPDIEAGGARNALWLSREMPDRYL